MGASQQHLTDIAVEVLAEIIFFKASSGSQKFAKITDILVSGSITDFFDVVNSGDDNNYILLAAINKIYYCFTSAEPDDLNRLDRQQIYRLFDSIVPAFCPENKIYFLDRR